MSKILPRVGLFVLIIIVPFALIQLQFMRAENRVKSNELVQSIMVEIVQHNKEHSHELIDHKHRLFGGKVASEKHKGSKEVPEGEV